MVLPYPYIVYGNVTYRDGSNVGITTVTVSDTTTPQGTSSVATNASGEYTCDIMNISTDGDTIQLFCSNNQEKLSTTFVLDISEVAKNVDLSLRSQNSKIIGSNMMSTYGVGKMILGRIK